jgi:hypothetical protein
VAQPNCHHHLFTRPVHRLRHRVTLLGRNLLRVHASYSAQEPIILPGGNSSACHHFHLGFAVSSNFERILQKQN